MTVAPDGPVRLVVFDLDGTLVDSRQDLSNATNALIEELGGQSLPVERVVGMVGEGAAVLVRRALAAAGLDASHPGALDRFVGLYEQRLLEHTRTYDGVAEMLDGVTAAHQAAVLTNKPTRATLALLEGLGLLRYFHAVTGGDGPLGRKPDPAGLLRLAADAGASPSQVLLVGDSPIDYQTARRAGSRICLARYGFGYSFASEDFGGDEWFIDEPQQLLGLLGQPPRTSAPASYLPQ